VVGTTDRGRAAGRANRGQGRRHALERVRRPDGGAASVSRAFPSCTRSIVAEIYLCHADFIVKKLRMETAG
jgi:hypothetical protein